MFADIQPYTVHLYHQLHDWLFMGGLVVAFAIPEVGALVRRRRWRRDVLAACR
jgi:hypothetical protein